MPEHSRVQPSSRLLLPVEWRQHIPPDVAAPLLALGRACNDIGTTLAVALVEQSRVLHQQQRAQQRNDEANAVEAQTAEQLWEAAQSYVEQLVDLYASTAARYVAVAVETAIQAINR